MRLAERLNIRSTRRLAGCEMVRMRQRWSMSSSVGERRKKARRQVSSLRVVGWSQTSGGERCDVAAGRRDTTGQ